MALNFITCFSSGSENTYYAFYFLMVIPSQQPFKILLIYLELRSGVHLSSRSDLIPGTDKKILITKPTISQKSSEFNCVNKLVNKKKLS